MSKQSVIILGSTGSVGQSTLDVIKLHADAYSVFALTADSNVEVMVQQCLEHQPSIAVMAKAEAAERLSKELIAKGLDDIEVMGGDQALAEIVQHADCDTVMSAIVGAAGLVPTLAAVSAAKRVLIANKEPLVMTGDLFMREAKRSGAVILPIDSEHNAVFQCLPDDQSIKQVQKVHLTASGGPFRGQKWNDLAEVTPDQACAHPNWSMGRKISVDSATMMNKGLEWIEASALFALPASQIEVLIHPQSIIHSLVEYCDGSFLAQLGAPDMRIPIAHALAWPERHSSGAQTLDLAAIARLDFETPDMQNLPCLALARDAAIQGGWAPAVLNAANEIAVQAFLDQRIGFCDIALVIRNCLERSSFSAPSSLEDVLQIDNEARRIASAKLDSL